MRLYEHGSSDVMSVLAMVRITSTALIHSILYGLIFSLFNVLEKFIFTLTLCMLGNFKLITENDHG